MNSDTLTEWNELNKDNAKHDLLSIMYGNLIGRCGQLDSFSTWLLAATGAAAGLVISNIQSITTILGKYGFKRSLICLVISAILGLCAKATYVFFQYGGDSQSKLFDQMKPILDHFFEQKGQIEETAKARNLSISTELQMEQLLVEYVRPFPFFVRLLTLRYLSKHKGNRQVGFLIPLKAFQWQSAFTLLQSIAFIVFIVLIIRYAQIA